MTLGQGHDTPSGNKLSFCKTSNVSPHEKYGSDKNFAQADGQTNGQSDSYIPSQSSFAGEGGLIFFFKVQVHIKYHIN